jgi:hypothetical protein
MGKCMPTVRAAPVNISSLAVLRCTAKLASRSGQTWGDTKRLGEPRDWPWKVPWRSSRTLDLQQSCPSDLMSRGQGTSIEMPWCYGYAVVVVTSGYVCNSSDFRYFDISG